jgi:4-amino-4-deoxy-L-arabinose transferase-like glycosyltransferase
LRYVSLRLPVLLGAPEAGAVLAVLFAATLPMGILQSSSTQNDYVVSFWLLAFVSQFLGWRRSSHDSHLLFAAAALGLAILTKGTALIFATPFGIWLLAPSPARSDQPHPRNQRLLHRPA